MFGSHFSIENRNSKNPLLFTRHNGFPPKASTSLGIGTEFVQQPGEAVALAGLAFQNIVLFQLGRREIVCIDKSALKVRAELTLVIENDTIYFALCDKFWRWIPKYGYYFCNMVPGVPLHSVRVTSVEQMCALEKPPGL